LGRTADPRELLKLGIDVGQTSVAKYMVHRRQPPSQTWKTFLANHIAQIQAGDFLSCPPPRHVPRAVCPGDPRA
jgi:hypothetical protein